jgi:hypothetical protein
MRTLRIVMYIVFIAKVIVCQINVIEFELNRIWNQDQNCLQIYGCFYWLPEHQLWHLRRRFAIFRLNVSKIVIKYYYNFKSNISKALRYTICSKITKPILMRTIQKSTITKVRMNQLLFLNSYTIHSIDLLSLKVKWGLTVLIFF